MKFANATVAASLALLLTIAGMPAAAAECSEEGSQQSSVDSVSSLDQGDAVETLTELSTDVEVIQEPTLEVVLEPMPEGELLGPTDEYSGSEDVQADTHATAAFGTELLSVLNAERARYSLPPLKLTVAAQAYAQSFTEKWTSLYSTCGTPSLAGCHMDPLLGGGKYTYRQQELKKQGWGNGGDLLARGFSTETAVANAWLNSDGHRAWIMNAYGPMNAIGLGKVSTTTTSGSVTITTNTWTLWIVGSPLTNPAPDMTEVGKTPGPVVKDPPGTEPDEVASAAVERLAGTCRYSTNLALNQKRMKPNKPLFIATGVDFPDALSIGPAVAKEGGSLMLASADRLLPGALELIKKNTPSAIYIVGGESAVSNCVASAAAVAAGKGAGGYTRISGSDRYSTSIAIFQAFFAGKNPSTVFVATGSNFPDALSAAAAGGAVGAPVLLVNGASAPSLTQPQKAALTQSKTKNVQIVGGPGVVNPGIEASLKASGYTTSRLNGSDRYGTNAAVNRYVSKAVGSSVTDMWVATGRNFPDALSAAAPAGNSNSRLVLSGGTCLPSGSVAGMITDTLDRVHLIGGTGALSPAIAALKQC